MKSCKFCRKEIDDDSRFCKYCGMAVYANTKLEYKDFIFDKYSRNKANLAAINEWLRTESLHIEDIKVEVTLNNAVIDAALIIKKLDMEYTKVDTSAHYKMGCFTSYTWNHRESNNFSKLEQKLAAWQSANPDDEITWKKFIEKEDESKNCVYQMLIFVHVSPQ